MTVPITSRCTTAASGRLCPVCSGEGWTYLFQVRDASVHRCTGCGLARLGRPAAQRPPAGAAVNRGIRGTSLRFLRLPDSPVEREAAAHYLELLGGELPDGGSILTITPTGHPFPDLAREGKHRVYMVPAERVSEGISIPAGAYDGLVILFRLEQLSDPIGFLQQVRVALKPGGALLLVMPSLDSWPARLLRGSWTEWRRENRYLFDAQTAHGALLKAGFAAVRAEPDRRRYSLQHLRDRAHAVPKTALTRLFTLASLVVPRTLRERLRLKVTTSAMVVTARRVEQRPRPLLTIVMPVYNERDSFSITMEAVLRKDVPGVDKEIIIVESGSSDGTRDLVRQYEARPGVTVILQDRPRGKGHAVREGFKHAQGDIILIQDADQEYDIEDYDALLDPLLRYERAFVLGSRHVAGWKIRQFNDQPGLGQLCNLGHCLFLGLLNTIYRQDLKDPFTMYKVFRRDCLHDVHLECNRFDFDFELVIKLLRKGYKPLEVPVTYRARSFRDGKKVSMHRDPLTWLRALAKYRFGSIYRSDRRERTPSDHVRRVGAPTIGPAGSPRPHQASGSTVAS